MFEILEIFAMMFMLSHHFDMTLLYFNFSVSELTRNSTSAPVEKQYLEKQNVNTFKHRIQNNYKCAVKDTTPASTV